MADYSIYVNLVALRLQGDSTLNTLVDGQVIPGFRRALADQFLADSKQACIGVRCLDDRSQGLPGCFSHETSEHDLLLEIRIITLLSDTRQDDSYAAAIASRIETLLKPGWTGTFDQASYQIARVGQIAFSPLADDTLIDRIELQGTIRLRYYG